MSTVDKLTADKIIAGEFPGEEPPVILRYNNQFNGAFAYKIVIRVSMLPYFLLECPAMRDPRIYWMRKDVKDSVTADYGIYVLSDYELKEGA